MRLAVQLLRELHLGVLSDASQVFCDIQGLDSFIAVLMEGLPMSQSLGQTRTEPDASAKPEIAWFEEIVSLLNNL